MSRRAIWYKLWGNATINPMSALTRSTADKLLDDETIRAFMAEAMDELAAIGAAIDCPIAESGGGPDGGHRAAGRIQDRRCSRMSKRVGRSSSRRCLERRARLPRGWASPRPQLDRLYAMTRLMGENLGLL